MPAAKLSTSMVVLSFSTSHSAWPLATRSPTATSQRISFTSSVVWLRRGMGISTDMKRSSRANSRAVSLPS
ncbi:MAG: hypothetical protein A2V99_16955 [Spirochaetes bacterium RBG_16_67_19]|nr:MAG: hypothetical protein A2V99_16955 [Spirochaetes bacterium RBG_16_67_19]